jgi:transposase
MGRTFNTNGEKRNACSIFVENPVGKRPLGRPRRRWKDNIMCLREIGWSGVDWIDLPWDWVQWMALVNTVMNLRFAQNFGKFLSS